MKKLTKTVYLYLDTPCGTYSESVTVEFKSLTDLEKQAEILSEQHYNQFIENTSYYYKIEGEK